MTNNIEREQYLLTNEYNIENDVVSNSYSL